MPPIPRIRPDELHDLARTWGFTLDEGEAEQLLAVAEGVFQAFDLLDSQPSVVVEPVVATRDPQVSGSPAIATASFIAMRMPESTPSALSARTRQKRTTAFRGSSSSAGGRPASRVAANGSRVAVGCDSSRS